MDKNLPNDPLEGFFKKSLEGMDDLPSDDGWDVPSVDVWDRVEENIQAPPVAIVRPINFWKWTAIAASFTVIFLAYQFFNRGQQINDLTAEINLNNQELESVKELLEKEQKEIHSTIAEEKGHPIHPISNQQSPKPYFQKGEEGVVQRDDTKHLERTTSFSGNREGSFGGKKNDGIPFVPNTLNQEVESSKVESSTIVFSSEQNNISSNSQEIVSDNSNTNTMSKEDRNALAIENLPNRFFETESSKSTSNDFTLNVPTLATIDLIPQRSNSKFYVGGYFSKNLGMRSLYSEDSVEGEARKNKFKSNRQKEYWTIGGGAKIGFQLNDKWSIETGIQYSKAKIESKHRIDKNYTSDSEIQNPLTGELENDYVLSIATPMGDIDSDVTLSRPQGFTIQEGMPFRVELSSIQNIEFLGIPILAKYRIGNDKINIGLKAGALTSFTLDSDIEIREVDHPFPMFYHKKNRIKDKSELKDLRSTTVDFMAGAGVEAEVKIAKSTYLSFEPSFSKSLSPIFEKNDVKTFPMMASVKVGVNYHF